MIKVNNEDVNAAGIPIQKLNSEHLYHSRNSKATMFSTFQAFSLARKSFN